MPKRPPGQVRDAIIAAFGRLGGIGTVQQIEADVTEHIGKVAPTSVRSYLRLNLGRLFERTARGEYMHQPNGLVNAMFTEVQRLPARRRQVAKLARPRPEPFRYGRQVLYRADCLQWLAEAPEASVHAVVTDPPYGLVEYQPEHQRKMREGRGGVWRIPPSFDNANRMPLPRFTVLKPEQRTAIVTFFTDWGRALHRVLRPGGHVLIAGNPLVSPLVSSAMETAGFERRGEIVRFVRTFRGGDRPKGAHVEFSDVSTMPRSCWEPWGLYRKPIDPNFRTLAENLRAWGTGGLRRVSADKPFLDVIESGITPDRERALAPHPSVKPQGYLRQIVRAMLPLGAGTILDPFAGCATTLAACEAEGIDGIGVELDRRYWRLATAAIPKLASLAVAQPPSPWATPLCENCGDSLVCSAACTSADARHDGHPMAELSTLP